MQNSDTPIIRRSDYRHPAWLVENVQLKFCLSPNSTRVRSTIQFRPNPLLPKQSDLALDGKQLRLISASINGQKLETGQFSVSETGLTVRTEHLSNSEFEWTSEVEINPSANTELEGLYISNGMYCTQCEPEGFRRICYFPDRPDVTTRFSTRIESVLPVLLSNGNLIKQGEGFAEWEDPWAKPSYLFALVAGDLVSVDDQFVTSSGRKVELRIWVRRGDENKCDYAMDSLVRAMKWDEEVYGRQYDLDQFNIVAVDDFNMGAMENKGLNIFNSKLVLASPDTATDLDYERIEKVIAHEYFHNWTGNRVTCRDWFQLSLKEGLTVFRDQQFSRDQRSASVGRIKDAQLLRSAQFREDSGPLAHPVRPESYRAINNFYTTTVYEKGAELVSMLHQLVGPDAYRSALDWYFERHDGEACTIEDWLKVFEDRCSRDLSQFKRWYSQSGTPRLDFEFDYAEGRLRLTLRQDTAETPQQPKKEPFVIPVAVGLLNERGEEIRPTQLLELTETEQTFEFVNLDSKPVVSVLRGFSAPVIKAWDETDADRLFLLRHDTDSFNRWDAGQELIRASLRDIIATGKPANPDMLRAFTDLILDDSQDAAFRALMIDIPSEANLQRELHETGLSVDPSTLYAACRTLRSALANMMADQVGPAYLKLSDPQPFSLTAEAAGQRVLRNALLRLLSAIDNGKAAARQFQNADNMTDCFGALRTLLEIRQGRVELDQFYAKWSHDRLVLDKWFALQVTEAPPERAVEITRQLTQHKKFEWKNPNRFRSVIAAFAHMNHAGFHIEDGSGYALVTDWLIKMDEVNPQVAARNCSAFELWRIYDSQRQNLIRTQIERMLRRKSLSADSREMLDRMLAA